MNFSTIIKTLPLALAVTSCIAPVNNSEIDSKPNAVYASFGSQCGTSLESEDVELLSGTLPVTAAYVAQHQSPVGRLMSSNGGCSGTLISADLFLTAAHCVANGIVGAYVEFNYQKKRDSSVGPVSTYNVTQVVEYQTANTSVAWMQDYAIIRLAGSPGNSWGVASIAQTPLAIGASIVMIGHPDALPKQVATGIVQGISGLYLDVTVDASGGNSGSGILDANGQLNGVFFRGGCGASGGLTYNGAMSMANLIILSPILTSLAVPPPSACPTFQITAQPANITVNAPGVATFSVTANGTPSSYQWQLSTDGGSSYSDIAGATTRTYTTGATNNLMSGYRYRCAVVNSCSFVQISNAAILTIGGNPVSILSSWSNNRVDKVPGTNRALVLIVNAKVSGPFSVTARYGGYSGSLMTLVVEKTQGTAYTGAFILNEAGIAAAPNGQFQVDYSSNPIAVSGTTVFLSNVNQTTLIGAISTGGTSGALTVSTGALANSSGDMEILGATALIDGNYSLNNGFVRGGVEQTLGWGDIVAGYAGGLGSSIIPSVTLSSSTTQSIIGFVVKSIGSTGTPNVSPTVSISSPTNGATFTAPATITINANAADGDGSVSKVEFFQGATKLGEDLTAPYSFAWTGIAAGNYSITAKATDNLGATTTSTAISVNVGNVSTGNVTPVGTWLTGTTHAKEVGTNRALVVLVYGERGGPMSVDSVTYGGKRMTLIVAKSQGTTTNSYTGAFILKEAGVAAATNGTIAVKWASAPSGSQVMSVFLTNVNQATSTGATAAGGSDNALTVTTSTLATVGGDLAFVAGTSATNGTYTLNNGFSRGGVEQAPSWGDITAGFKAATGASETPSLKNSLTQRQSIIGFVVKK